MILPRHSRLKHRYKRRGMHILVQMHPVIVGTDADTHMVSVKKRLNVDSPTFTPSSLRSNGLSKGISNRTISPKAANAAPFTPKKLNPGMFFSHCHISTSSLVLKRPSGSATSFVLQGSASPRWGPSEIPEFVPQSFENLHVVRHRFFHYVLRDRAEFVQALLFSALHCFMLSSCDATPKVSCQK